MFTDLVITGEIQEKFGFGNIIKVDIITINSANDLIQRLKTTKKPVVVEGGLFNREILSNKKVDMLLSPEKMSRKDFMHSRNSGLNHVLCKLANKNKIAIGFNFNDILKSKNKGQLIGRMMQNVKLCRKYKVDTVFASFSETKWDMRPAKDLINFATVLGMHPTEANDSLSNLKVNSSVLPEL